MSNFQLIDTEFAYKNAVNYIASTERQLAVVKLVIEELKTLEGKTITKRIISALQKTFPQYTFYMSSPYSWHNIDISGEGFDEIHLMLGYKSQINEINAGIIIDLNQRYLLDEGRLVEYRRELDSLVARSEAYNAALLALHRADNELGTLRHTITQNDSLYLRDANGRSVLVNQES